MGATMFDINMMIQAGIDPKTHLPIRASGTSNLKDQIKHNLRIMDEQAGIRRFTWHGLPSGLTGALLERILYYRGQGMFFFMPENEKFYFLPYSLSGTIDCYGRWTEVTPLPFNGGSNSDKDKNRPWIQGLTKKVLYEMPEQFNLKDFEDSCVILKDYTPQLSETVVPRQILNETIIDMESEAFPMARTNLLANSGIKGMKVSTEDGQANVKAASNSITKAALEGSPWIPIVGDVNLESLTDGGSALKAEEYLLYCQALDCWRLSQYGLEQGGIWKKHEYQSNTEQQLNQGNVGLIMQDGLTLRKEFCDMVNATWGLGISVEVSETITNTDNDGNGLVEDQTDTGLAQTQEVQNNVTNE